MNNFKSLSKPWHAIVALFVVGLMLVTGCSGTGMDDSAEGGSETISPLTAEMLKNTEYRGIYPDTVQLTDGQYEGEPFVEGGASRPTVAFTDATAFGDLNGDGVDDAVVVLVESSGGSGNFRYLAAVLNQDGSPENVATQLIGDREQVQSVTIDGAEVSVKALTHGPEDPMCCPTEEITLTYRFDGEQLVKISEERSSEETPTDEAPAALNGTQWTLASYVDSQGETVHVLPDTELTAQFTTDQIAGSAGCNDYFASYQIDGAGLTVGPVGATRKACDEPAGIMAQERDYLAALKAATGYQVEGDTLRLLDAEGAPMATFTPAGEADIIDITWQWAELTETEPASQSLVPDPEGYTLVLRSDGTYQVKADCNSTAGDYVLEGNRLTLLPGPATLVECGTDSLYDEYLAFLDQVVTFELDGENLVLNLNEGAGKMGFVKGVAKAEIIDITWQWAELTETEPASQSLVPDPENYTLVLRSDGTYQVKADCNVGSGAYTLEGNNLMLEPGPMTLGECAPESLFDLYLTKLGSVESLSVEDGRLTLHLGGNAGKMVFRNAGPADETDSGPAGADITGTVWMWTETTAPTGVTSVGDPEKYTIELLPDDQFRVRADCNRGNGSYTLADGTISFEFGPMTLAECEQGSLSDQFIKELSAAVIYFLQGEELFIDLKSDSGTMRFVRSERGLGSGNKAFEFTYDSDAEGWRDLRICRPTMKRSCTGWIPIIENSPPD